MHSLPLPALRGNSPLGFLTALGTLEITTRTLTPKARLSWQGPAQPALLHTPEPLTRTELADHLQQQLPTQLDTEPLPHVPGLLSRRRDPTPGSPNEPLRMPPATAHDVLRGYAAQERENHTPHARWFTALVNQLHTAEKSGHHYTSTTPMFAPSGRMTLTQSWAESAALCHKNPAHLHDALTTWLLRVPNFAGASLDHHSALSAHTAPDGVPSQHGLPGPTWLALHSFPYFRLTGDGTRRRTTGWKTSPHGTTFHWPTWRAPLPPTAITTLLEHPLIHHHTPQDRDRLDNLGITAIYTTRRPRLSNSEGALAPAQQHWPPPTSEPQAHTETPHYT